jgi:flagellar basal body-associated protein FliL
MTFKELSFKKKLEHIWEYYRWIILVLAVVVFACSSIFYSMFIKKKPVNFAGVAFYDINLSDEQYTAIENSLNEALELTYPDTVEITDYYFIDDDVVFNNEMSQRFTMNLFAEELQVFVSDAESFEDARSQGVVADLTEYYSDEQLAALDEQGRLLYMKNDEDGTEKPYGIKVNESAIFSQCDLYSNSDEPAYAGIIPIKDHTDNAKAALDEIIKE